MNKKLVWFGKNKSVATVLKEDGARVKILRPGRKRAEWVSKTQVSTAGPKTVVLHKKISDFNPKCTCHAVFEVTKGQANYYNVYGNLNKYFRSDINKGSDLSPYHRRKQLAEVGFTRAKSKGPEKVKDQLEKVHQLQKKGYAVK